MAASGGGADPARPGTPGAAASSSTSSAHLIPVNGGRYWREHEDFGHGTFGRVFEAVPSAPRAPTLPLVHGSRRVCLKLVDLPPTGLSREHASEVRLWSVLDHPNVAPLRDWFEDTDVAGGITRKRLGLVTDLYEHGSLRAVLDRDIEERTAATREGRAPRPFLTPRHVRTIAQGVLAGLDYLHTRTPPIVHRNLKPENVCLGAAIGVDGVESSDGSACRVFASEDSLEVRIIDFGTSEERFEAMMSGRTSEERFETLMSSGTLRHGTLAYLGPQRASRGGYSGSADDCWAAGLLLAECLLGEGIFSLFPSPRKAWVTDTLEVLRSKLPSGRPEELGAVVRRCLEKDAVMGRVIGGLLALEEGERWSSGRALGELEAACSGMGRLVRDEMEALERRAVAAERRAEVAEARANAVEEWARSRFEELTKLVEELRGSASSRAASGASAGGSLRTDMAALPPDPNGTDSRSSSSSRPILQTREYSLAGHTNQVVTLLAHPSRRLLISSGEGEYSVRVWDLETRCLLRTLTGHTSIVFGLALDPAGRRLASGSFDRSLKLWDLDSGACLRTLTDESINAVHAVVWDAAGTLIASGSYDNCVCIWDADSGALRHTLEGHSGSVYALAAHPTDDLLASGSYDFTVRVWRWSSGAHVFTLEGHIGSVNSLVASAAWLVSGSFDKSVRVWSWTTGECVRVLDGFAGTLNLNSLAWRDSTLVTLEYDGREGMARVWDTSAADPSAWSCLGSLPSKASSGCGVAVVGGGRVACAAPGDSKMIIVRE